MKKKYRNMILILMGIVIVSMGFSYAWWRTTETQTNVNTIKSRCLKFDIVEEKNDIKLENSYPITDEEAKKLTPYTFAIENQCEENINYTVKMEQLQKEREELLSSQYVAIEINEGQKEILGEYKEGKKTYEGNEYTSVEARELVKGTLKGKEKREYAIKIWIDEKVSEKDNAMNKSFISKIVVDGTINEEYNEPILHGTDPVLKEGLIPVTIDNKGTVRKAKLTEEWYSYEKQEWANAVILVNGKTADDYQDNEQIPDADIESYFVWIPKYKYKIFDMGKYNKRETTEYESKVQPIEIKYGITNTTDNEIECTAPASGEDGECQEGKWMTHPAFTAFETNGIWVGKFKTGYKGATSTDEAENATNTNKVAPEQIIIKPNEYSWRNISVGNAFKTSLGYNKNLNSHMMKNTEWGAVAYLTNSIYGRCDKDTKECSEIRINNNENRLTGYAAKTEPTTGATGTNESCTAHPEACNEWSGSSKGADGDANYQYFNTNSVMASTTNNYTGIYDMSGGSWEYVMGVMVDANDKPINLNSELSETDLKDKRYYDAYKNGIEFQYTSRILGDATGEIGPFILEKYTGTTSAAVERIRTISSWYHDQGLFVMTDNTWFLRGSNYQYGFESGVFTFDRVAGEATVHRAFRLALAF